MDCGTDLSIVRFEKVRCGGLAPNRYAALHMRCVGATREIGFRFLAKRGELEKQ